MVRLLLLSMILFVWTSQAKEINTNCPTVEIINQDFCESEGTGNYFHKPRIGDLVATDGGDGVVWYATATSTEALAWDVLLVSGEDYYADNLSGSCSIRTAVIANIFPAPNAGATTWVYICPNGQPVDLLINYKSSLLGPPQPGGIMIPPLASGNTVFDPSVDLPGQYKYRVESQNNVCPDDDSIVYVSFLQAPNTGENGIAVFSSIGTSEDLFGFLGGAPEPGGTWFPALASGTGVFNPSIDVPGLYSYSLSGVNGCNSTSTVEVSITGTDKLVCHKGKTVIVKENQLAVHLNHGDVVGECSTTANLSEKVAIYPNPGKGVYEFRNQSLEINNIKISNSNGIFMKEFKAINSSGIQKIDISEFKSGMYFVEISTSLGIVTKRLIKH